MTHPALAELATVLEAKDREIADLRTALGWYAQPKHWRRTTAGRNWTNSPAAIDRGDTARLALLMLEGMK